MKILAERPARGLPGPSIRSSPRRRTPRPASAGPRPRRWVATPPGNIDPCSRTSQAPADDTHLRHAVRIALRDQLLTPEAWDYVAAEWAELEESYLADVAPGVPSAESARFLLDYLSRHPEPLADPGPLRPPRRPVRRPRGRGGAGGASPALEAPARSRRSALLKAIQQGTQERGAALGPDARGLAAEVARALLASARANEIQAGIELAGSMKLEGAVG